MQEQLEYYFFKYITDVVGDKESTAQKYIRALKKGGIVFEIQETDT